MFTDEIYEKVLIEQGGKLTTAHFEAYNAKLDAQDGKFQYIDYKQIENGYQLFRKRHPEFPEHSFRRFVWVRLCNQGCSDEAERVFRICGWPELTKIQLYL